jgi:dethiobiotin synthetase
MGAGVFITGTDTGVGKTFVACGIAAVFKENGYRVGVMKPAETGCTERDGVLYPEDAARLKEASASDAPLEKICPYRFKEPLAPSVAAERAGGAIDIDRVCAVYSEIAAENDLTIVEGAGGLLVPLLPHYTYSDLAKLLKLPVIVVAANRLGAINHLTLTLETAATRGLTVLGYVWNQLEPEPSLAGETNPDALRFLSAVPCLGEIPYIASGNFGRAALADVFETQVGRAVERALMRR